MCKRLVTVSLVPAGVVIGHALGYLVLDPVRHSWQPTFVTHGVYPTLLAVALLVAAVVVSWVALTRYPIRQVLPRAYTLGAAQVAAFLLLEAVERLAVGEAPSALLHEPGLGLALAAQLVAAAVMTATLRGARHAITFLRVRRCRPRSSAPSAPAHRSTAPVQGAVSEVHRGCLSRRGPPAEVTATRPVAALT